MIIKAGLTPLIVGPAGGGKTEAVRALAEGLGSKFYPISLGPQTTQAQLFGYMHAEGGYVTTVFREAYEFGGVLLLDEWDRCNNRVSVTMNAAIANGRCVFPDSKVVERHKDCIFVAAANTAGFGADRQYVSATQQDAATIDRFVHLDWPYDLAFEAQIAKAIDEHLADKWLKYVRSVRKETERLKMRYIVGPRTTIYSLRMANAGADEELIHNTVIFGGWLPEDRKKVEQAVKNG
jgi:cobaltochelatase CobS